jgi:hypothetical protein
VALGEPSTERAARRLPERGPRDAAGNLWAIAAAAIDFVTTWPEAAARTANLRRRKLARYRVWAARKNPRLCARTTAWDSPELARHPLAGRRDVLLTPHVAFYSESALADLRRISARNIRAFLDGRPGEVFRLVTT